MVLDEGCATDELVGGRGRISVGKATPKSAPKISAGINGVMV